MDSRDLSGVGWSVMFGSCLDRLPELADNSVDAVVCDPPYELGFMGKSWDSSGIAFNSAVWAECLRVLKPGGHLLAFGGSRTWHRIAVAVEDAGFEIRDSIAWLYGSGFPKSLDVSKAIDKAAGVERETLTAVEPDLFGEKVVSLGDSHGTREGAVTSASVDNLGGYRMGSFAEMTKPNTPEAVKWQGWGTALKPAFEPVIVGRKPLVGTVAANVLLWGTGGLNIDGTRIGSRKDTPQFRPASASGPSNGGVAFSDRAGQEASYSQGRWPSNVMLDEVTAGMVDEQSGVSASKVSVNNRTAKDAGILGTFTGQENVQMGHNDSGGASRFFYVAKASKRDRNEGLDELEDKQNSKFAQDSWSLKHMSFGNTAPAKNFHPTVKPTDLMRQLVRLVTPPGGVVLDPFTGSGSTGKAAILEGFEFIGCELTEDYLPIIQVRIDWAVAEVARIADMEEEKLF